MKNKIFFPALFLLSSFSLFSQDFNNLEERIPLNGVVYSCDEPVDMEGDITLIVDYGLIDAGAVIRYYIDGQGKGTGLSTGLRFELGEYALGSAVISPGENTISGEFKVLGIPKGSFLLKYTIYLFLDDNGKLFVKFGDFEGICK
jgi:hypothetical protein